MKTALILLALAAPAFADVQQVKHRVTGLFSKEREDDLREAVKTLADVMVVSIDFDAAEVVFSYDPAKLFKGSKEKDYIERFDQILRNATKSTFGIRPLSAVPKEKLAKVEIAVYGNDCKACDLAVYESVYKIEGVEAATASFHTGKLIAFIDPDKTNKAALEEALKKRNVKLTPDKPK